MSENSSYHQKEQGSPDAIIAGTSRAKQQREGKLGNCSKTLHIGLFFDGVGRNKDLDRPKGKTSNITKLFYIFNDKETNTENDIYLKYYFYTLAGLNWISIAIGFISFIYFIALIFLSDNESYVINGKNIF